MGCNQTRAAKNSPQITDKQIRMLKELTRLSEADIRAWHQGFIRDCPDGKLNRNKFTEVYQKFYPNGKAKKFCKFAFNAFDKNQDGSIDFDEFITAISISSSGSLDTRLGLAFDMCDISKDGYIDQKELRQLIDAIYDLVNEEDRSNENEANNRAEQLMAKIDTNDDKKISKAEFIASCKNDPTIRRWLAPNS